MGVLFVRLESALEEGSCGIVGGEPVAMEQKVMDFVGEDQLFHGDVARAQSVGPVSYTHLKEGVLSNGAGEKR